MSKFSVETDSLTNAANKLEGKVGDYNAQVNRLYLEIQSLRVEWSGKSSDTFNSKIDSFRNDFDAIANAVLSYVELLRQDASVYEQTEDGLVDNASQLNSGN